VFTACVKSNFSWNLDGLLFFNIKHRQWSWDLGYEVKARARETLDCNYVSLCAPCNENSRSCDPYDCDCNTASIGTKQYGVKGPQIIGAIGTQVLDAVDTTINTFGKQAVPYSVNGTQVDSLVTPSSILINANNFMSYLDFESTRIPGALANKVWSHLAYTWDNRYCPIAAGVGFEIDFGAKNRQPRLWGIWGKVTVAYS
jgi:hypothetical protein